MVARAGEHAPQGARRAVREFLPCDQQHYARLVKTALEAVGGGMLGGVAYSMRHGGPAWDRYNQFWSVAEVKSRGR